MAAPRGPAMMMEKEKRSRPMRVLLRSMFGYLGQFKRIIFGAAILSILATIFLAVDPLVLSWGIDLVMEPGTDLNNILILGALFTGLKVTSWVLASINTWIMAGAQAGFVRSLQQDVYNKLVKADLSYHHGEQSGDVTSRVTSDTDSLGAGIQIIIELASQILLVIATFTLMWMTSPFVALAALMVVPVVILIMVIFGTVGQRIMLATHRAAGKVSGQIAENLGGVQVAKAFNREKETSSTLGELNEEAYRHGFKFMMLMTLMQPLIRATGIAAVSAILFVGGTLITGSTSTLTLGEVFLGTILIQRFFMPLLILSMNATQFQASLASMDRLMDVLEAEPKVRDSDNASPLKDDSDGIRFENVTFSYLEGSEVLRDVSFTIEPEKMVAIVGHTGAGKSTVASLLSRFYDPQEGNVLIGDQNIKDIKLASLHDSLALIAQEPYLFDGTIYDNIRYACPSASNEEIMELSKMIGAHEFIEVLPAGYDTQLIEEGKNLSAGQIQMISIARTMLADPKILILDEATSRLDAYSESLVQEAQERLFSKRTTIVIAHRLSTIAKASRILVFDHGKLVEQGTNEELLSLGGRYKALYDTYYSHQSASEISEDTMKVAGKEMNKVEKKPGMTSGKTPGKMGGMGSGAMHRQGQGHGK